MNQLLDKVQQEFQQSKGETNNLIFGHSSFIQSIQEEPLPTNFRLPSLEAFDGSFNLVEHTTTFQTQMSQFSTSNALMC